MSSNFQSDSISRYTVRRCDDSNDQSLLIQLGIVHQQLSRPPYHGPTNHNILHESNTVPLRITVFPLPLQELQDPSICHLYTRRLLAYVDLDIETCDIVAKDITSLIGEVLAAGNLEVKFRIVALIDRVQMIWREETGKSRGGSRRAAIERLMMMEKFDGFEEGRELGDCCICYEELKGEEKEVSRIGCGHVYHKSCIINWVLRNDSCPLCRSKI